MNAASDAPSLRHIIVVGGTLAEWGEAGDAAWADRLEELGKVADHVGANWLTVRPYEGAPASTASTVPERSVTVGNCLTVAHPQADGRERVAEAVRALQESGAAITEQAIARLLDAPAATDPDLVVVLGDGNRLPPSLVWELAYSELVFIPTEWSQFCASHLEAAIDSYAHRNRRFGGVDD